MVDATRVFSPGFQVTNASGTPQSGAVLRFYAAGTSNTRTVYSDLGLSTSLGVTVTTNSSGRPAASGGSGAESLIYTGTTPYKVTAETSAGVSLWSFDNVIGALDTSSFLTGTVIAEYPVVAKTSNYSVVDGDEGKVINGNPTGGSFTLTLPSAVTVGNGWNVSIRHVGTANNVTIATVSAQTIDGATSRVLSSQYESMTLVADGANWHLKDATRLILPRGYIDGCIISNGTDATNDINIAAGVCRDSTNSVNITVAAIAGKQLDANWATGANAGMRNSAVGIANTTYHIYAVVKADGTQDIYAHTSTTVATVITALQAESGGASYVYARRIGSIIRASSAILGFTQRGGNFTWVVQQLEFNAIPADTNAHTLTLAYSPAGLVVQAELIASQPNAGAIVLLSALTDTDAAPSTTVAPLGTVSSGSGGGAVGMALVWTNTSAQIRYRSTDIGVALRILTKSYNDPRDRDA